MEGREGEKRGAQWGGEERREGKGGEERRGVELGKFIEMKRLPTFFKRLRGEDRMEGALGVAITQIRVLPALSSVSI